METEIKIIMLRNGDQIAAEILEESKKEISFKNPMLITFSYNPLIAKTFSLNRWEPFADGNRVYTVNRENILTVIDNLMLNFRIYYRCVLRDYAELQDNLNSKVLADAIENLTNLLNQEKTISEHMSSDKIN